MATFSASHQVLARYLTVPSQQLTQPPQPLKLRGNIPAIQRQVTKTMGNPNAFLSHQIDGKDQRAIPLRVPEQILVSSVAGGNAIALLLKQPNDQHQCQWGLTIEQADWLIEMLQKARDDASQQADKR